MTLTAPPTTPVELEQQLADAVRLEHWPEAERLGAVLDQLCTESAPPGLLHAALWYASLGIPVFPLEPGGKRPYPGSHGCKDASCDPVQIRAWWDAAPTSNIGIATGHAVDVIDLDGAAGVKSWAGDMWDATPPLIGTVRTRRPGGWHLYVTPTGMGNRAGMFPGVDYRGKGGYVLGPPSVVDGVTYRWVQPLELTR